MIYGELDLATLERNAWQAGNYDLAEAYALALEAEERETELEEREEKADEDYSHCQEAWAAHNAAMRQRLDNLRQLVEQAARVSGRELMLERITEAEALIDKAEGS